MFSLRKTFTVAMAVVMTLTPAIAAPGITTTDVNFRSGPSTSFESLGVLPAGTNLTIGDCDDTGSWCAVTAEGTDGFVSGQYLQEVDDPTGWPRSFELGDGATIVLYQPQFTSWDNSQTVTALVAAEYITSQDATPQFGVIGVAGRTTRVEEADEVVISDIKVTEFNFAGLDRDAAAKLSLEADKLLPTGPITVAETRIVASLAEQARMVDVEGLKADPPIILVTTGRAILVQTNGEAAFAPVSGTPGVSFLVNTNWDLFRVDDGEALFLRDELSWLTAPTLDGEWTEATDLPDALSSLPDNEDWSDARAAIPPQPFGDTGVPQVLVTDEPAEMIAFDGEPTLEDVPGTGLQWASNTESDVFFDTGGSEWYFLISGRWFKSSSLDGPWAFATPELPQDFQRIPPDAPYHSVRSSIPGTPESAEARLRASIPTTARVEIGSVTPDVAYAGDKAQFEPIEGTDLTYAANTADAVIEVDGRYFLLQDGVWFVSESPAGPWTVATEVAEEIYEIPPSSHLYNVTYVRVYDTEPGAVWFGYTMGYLTGFLAWGTYVYGTGWRYAPYWYRWPGYSYPIYYPRPVAWGVGAYYNPVRGAYGRYGYAYGPYRGIAGARSWNPRTGRYTRAGAAWGPRGQAGFIGAYNPRTDTGGYLAGSRNVYGSWQSAGVKRGSDWARITARDGPAGSGVRWGTSEGNRGFVREGRRGNMYAGNDGNVYRNTGDGWQVFDGGWNEVERPAPSELLERGEGLQGLSPEARDRFAERRGAEALQSLGGAAAGAGAGAAVGNQLRNRPAGDRLSEQAPTRSERQQGRPGNSRTERPTTPRAATRQTTDRPTRRSGAPQGVQRAQQSRNVGNQRRNAQRSSARRAPARSANRGGGRRR